MESTGRRGMGWIPDYPDFRDYTEKTEEVKLGFSLTGIPKAKGLPIMTLLAPPDHQTFAA